MIQDNDTILAVTLRTLSQVTLLSLNDTYVFSAFGGISLKSRKKLVVLNRYFTKVYSTHNIHYSQ